MVKNCQQFDTFFTFKSVQSSSTFSCQFWFPCSNVQFCEWDIRFAKLDYKWTHCVSIVSTQQFCDDPHHQCLLQVNIWGRGLWTSKIAANQVENRPMKTYSMHVNLAANERLKDPFWNCWRKSSPTRALCAQIARKKHWCQHTRLSSSTNPCFCVSVYTLRTHSLINIQCLTLWRCSSYIHIPK